MHLILLGVQKKINLWINGTANFKTKLIARDVIDISNNLSVANQSLPADINRAIRGFEVIHFWKATEFRTFLLKTEP